MQKMTKVKITAGCHLVGGIHRTKDHAPFEATDTVARMLVRLGHAEILDAPPVHEHRGFIGPREVKEPAVGAIEAPHALADQGRPKRVVSAS